MKIKTKIICIISLIISCICFNTNQIQAFDTSYAVDLAFNTLTNGSVDEYGDEGDLYRFTVDQTSIFEFELIYNQNNGCVHLYDENGKIILEHYEKSSFTETWYLRKGTYYLKLNGFDWWTMKDYSICLTHLTDSTETIIEDYNGINETLENYINLEFGKTYDGQVSINDVDYYKFNVNETSKYVLDIGKSNKFTNVSVYNQKGEMIWDRIFNLPINGNPNVAYELLLKKGEYYIKFYDDSFDEGWGDYTFKLKFLESCHESFLDSYDNNNDTKENASSIRLNETYDVQITLGDNDWFKLVLDKKTKIIYHANVPIYYYDEYDEYWDEELWDNEVYELEPGIHYFNISSSYYVGAKYTICFEEVSPFLDVNSKKWYYNYVMEANDLGSMTGTTETTFAPDANMTRGMIVTVLHRIAGKPDVAYQGKFQDVPSKKYCAIPVEWAAQNKVVSGFKDGTYGPDDNITRQDVAVILHNYAKSLGMDLNKTKSLTLFNDYKKVSSYAKSALEWATGVGILSGTKVGDLNPKGNATRAECAKMLVEFYKLVNQ